MKNRKIDALVNLCIFALWLIVASILIIYACSFTDMSVLDTFMYSITGLVLNYVVALAFHELGHVIFAKICKMRLLYINFGLFSIDFTAKKKLRLLTYFQPEAGELAFLPQTRLKKGHLKLIAFGGLLFSLIISVAVLIPLFFLNSVIAFCLLGVGSCSCFFLLTVNLLPFDKTSDGSVLLTNRDYCEVITEAGNHQKQVLDGEIPEEANVFKVSQEPIAVYYHYLYLLLQNRREEAFFCISSLQQSLEDLTNDEYTLIFPEVLFVSCEREIGDEELNSRAEIFFSEEVATPAILRSHALYRKFYGEKEWAETLFSSYQKSLESAPLFIQKCEQQIDIQAKFKRHG